MFFFAFNIFCVFFVKGLETASLSPVKDAYVDEDMPDSNYGEGSLLKVGYVEDEELKELQIFISFNISAFRYKAVQSVKLKLFCTQPYGITRTFQIRRITQDWNETDITWNNRPSVSSDYINVVFNLTSNDWWVVDVTSLYVAGETIGFRIADVSTPQYCENTFTSREYSDPAYRPVLEVTYEPYDVSGVVWWLEHIDLALGIVGFIMIMFAPTVAIHMLRNSDARGIIYGLLMFVIGLSFVMVWLWGG